MPTTFLNLFSIECLILAIYVFSFNFPIERIILNKRLYSLLLLIASLTAFIINVCINTRNIISKNLIAVIIMSILLTVLLITLIFKSRILTFDNASIQEFDFPDFTPADTKTNELVIYDDSTDSKILFRLFRPASNISFTAYCIEISDDNIEKTYKCISYSYIPAVHVLIENIFLFLMTILAPFFLLLKNDSIYFGSISVLFIITALLHKLISKNNSHRFISTLIYISEFLILFLFAFLIIK